MSSRPFHLHNGQKGSALAIRVTPRASHNEITEVMSDGTVKVRLTSGPADDQTNDALVVFLAEVLGITPNKVEVVAGAPGRDKLVSILDLDAETVHARILKKLS